MVDEKFTDLIELAPELKWDMRALGKELNPEVEAQFGEANIKFHHHSLDCIINIEKHKKAFKFLSKLSLFKEFYPLVSGTIPLGIDVEGSDLDILMECRNKFEVGQFFAILLCSDGSEKAVIKNDDHWHYPTFFLW